MPGGFHQGIFRICEKLMFFNSLMVKYGGRDVP